MSDAQQAGWQVRGILAAETDDGGERVIGYAATREEAEEIAAAARSGVWKRVIIARMPERDAP
jgi:hypothetical protein